MNDRIPHRAVHRCLRHAVVAAEARGIGLSPLLGSPYGSAKTRIPFVTRPTFWPGRCS